MTKHTKFFLLYVFLLLGCFPIGMVIGAIADEWFGWPYYDANILAVMTGAILMGCLGASALWYMHVKYKKDEGNNIPTLLRIRFLIVNWSLVLVATILLLISIIY